LVESGADVNVRNSQNQTPLDIALARRKREVTGYLMNHMGVMDPYDSMDISSLDKTPDILVPDATLPSVGIAKHEDPHGRLSLHNICKHGTVEDVRLLLDLGTNINGLDAVHNTALFVALQNGNLETATVLIQYGADVNCRDKTGETPLMSASALGYHDIAVLLLDHGAEVNAKEEDLWTALHHASSNGHLEIIKVLLDRGADIHARNIDGRTPGRLASRIGRRDIVQLLSDVKVQSTV